MHYDRATLADIEYRLGKGWVIRPDENRTLLNMAIDLLKLKESAPAITGAGTEETLRKVLKDWGLSP